MENNYLNRNRNLIIAFLLFLLPFTLYWQVINHDFVIYDDQDYITENRHVTSGWSKDGLIWAFTSGFHGHWHPLTWLSHMTDVQLFGLHPGGHHLISVLIHAFSTVLLFLVFLRMTGKPWPSAFIAAVFAVHPLNVESVAWASERKNALSTLFLMLTLWAYMRYALKPGIWRYLLILCLFSMGLMSKVTLVTLPVTLLLFDFWPLVRVKQTWFDIEGDTPFQKSSPLKLILEKVPLLFLSVASTFILFYLFSTSDTAASPVMPKIDLFGDSVHHYGLPVTLKNYLIYTRHMFYPFDLAVLYPPFERVPLWQVIGSGLVILGLSAFFIRKGRHYPYLPVGWFWFLLTFAPMIGLFKRGPGYIADRHMYLPMIGLLLLIAWGVPELFKNFRSRRVGLSVLAGLSLFLLSILTFRQIGFWKDSVTLFYNTVNVTPENHYAYNNLGVALDLEGKSDDAVLCFREALRINPVYFRAHNNVGNILVERGKVKEAVLHFRQALEPAEGKYWEIHANLGSALAQLGRYDEAIPHYEAVLKKRPDHAEVHSNLGIALASLGKMEAAESHLREAIRLRPDMAQVQNNLGRILTNQGKPEEAIRHLREALRLDPENPIMHHNMGLALAAQGKWDEAISHYDTVLRVKPSNGDVLYAKGLAFMGKGDRRAALKAYRTLREVDPRLGKKLARKIYAR
jgi:tetratricopeptide (TPR) repeat protein